MTRPRYAQGNLRKEDATHFAERLAAACSRALGDVAEGIVLHGSLALGDYTPGHSDVDLLVIVARPWADGEITAVTDAIAADAREAPARVDLRVVTREVAATPTPTPLLEVAIEIRPSRDPAFHVERGPRGERDLVIEFSMCRAIGRSLAGAPATELIGDVPPDWILAVGDAQLADWQAMGDDPPHAQLTVLTACRIWRFAEERRHCSKAAAGEWALQLDPSLTVVRAALRQREVDPATSISPVEVQQLLHVVRERIASARDLTDLAAGGTPE